MVGRVEIKQQVTAVLVDLFDVEPEAVKEDAELYADLDIDSIDAVDMVVELKKITGKKIKPEDFKSVKTVRDVIDAAEQLIQND